LPKQLDRIVLGQLAILESVPNVLCCPIHLKDLPGPWDDRIEEHGDTVVENSTVLSIPAIGHGRSIISEDRRNDRACKKTTAIRLGLRRSCSSQ
jgi:hypothetical protein